METRPVDLFPSEASGLGLGLTRGPGMSGGSAVAKGAGPLLPGEKSLRIPPPSVASAGPHGSLQTPAVSFLSSSAATAVARAQAQAEAQLFSAVASERAMRWSEGTIKNSLMATEGPQSLVKNKEHEKACKLDKDSNNFFDVEDFHSPKMADFYDSCTARHQHSGMRHPALLSLRRTSKEQEPDQNNQMISLTGEAS